MSESNEQKAAAEQAPEKTPSTKQLANQVSDLAGKLDRVVDSTNAALTAMSAQFADLIGRLSDSPRQSDAINNPASITRDKDIRFFDYRADGMAEFEGNTTNLIKPARDEIDIHAQQRKDDETAFMAELVDIVIQDVSDKDAARTFMIAVNGRGVVLQRGQRYQLPRNYLAVLLGARPIHYGNEEYIDQTDGVRKVRWPSHRGLLYPFSVLRDTQRGMAWLEKATAA